MLVDSEEQPGGKPTRENRSWTSRCSLQRAYALCPWESDWEVTRVVDSTRFIGRSRREKGPFMVGFQESTEPEEDGASLDFVYFILSGTKKHRCGQERVPGRF